MARGAEWIDFFRIASPMTLLTTSRLRLEPFTQDHLAGLNKLNSDPEVMRYISAGRPETLEDTRAVIERVMTRWRELGYSWWAIVERVTGEVVGAGAIQNLRREATLVPDLACPLEIGWRLRRDRWGQGLAVEAANAMGDFAFRHLKARELLAVCDPANTASANVMKRLGMQEAGVQRWYGKDLLTYRIGADQWIEKIRRRVVEGG
jgi:RimJ/RimL family protein N-acetyltransferase